MNISVNTSYSNQAFGAKIPLDGMSDIAHVAMQPNSMMGQEAAKTIVRGRFSRILQAFQEKLSKLFIDSTTKINSILLQPNSEMKTAAIRKTLIG